MYVRLLAALLLTSLISAAAVSQPPKDKEPGKEKEVLKLDGRDVKEWAKMINDKDPANRHRAIVALEQFPPLEVRRHAGKELFRKIAPGNEVDNGVRINTIDLVGRIGGIDDPIDSQDTQKEKDAKEALNRDAKEAALHLANSASSGNGVLRLHSLQALGGFGHKAHDRVGLLTGGEMARDQTSYEIRRALAQTLARIGSTESSGSSPQALRALATLVKDNCVPVRLEALQSLAILGPAYADGFVHKADSKEMPRYNETLKNEIINVMKARIGEFKSKADLEPEKQLELWCRLVIIRFSVGDVDEVKRQAAGIAQHVTEKDTAAVRLQALQGLGMLGELAAPHLGAIISLTNDTDKAVCLSAIHTLGAIGSSVARGIQTLADAKEIDAKRMGELAAILDQIVQLLVSGIDSPTKDLQMRIAALDALAMLGEKASPGLSAVLRILDNPENIKDADGMALLSRAINTVAAMGVKAKSAIDNLEGLKERVRQAKKERLNSKEYLDFVNSPQVQKLLAKLTKEQRDKLLSDKDTVEDKFIQVIDEMIRYIRESAPGRPGPDPKKPGVGVGG